MAGRGGFPRQLRDRLGVATYDSQMVNTTLLWSSRSRRAASKLVQITHRPGSP